MTTSAKTHLNDEQMYDLLEGNGASGATHLAAAHLADCASCRAELATLRGSLASFRHAATGFAAAQGPTAAPRRAKPAGFWAVPLALRLGRQGWAASMATVIVLAAVSVTLIHPRRDAFPVVPTHGQNAPVATASSSSSSPESDEALLDGIQRDLSTSIPPSLEPLALPATKSATSSRN